VFLKLSPKQKKWIDENKNKLTVDEISKKYNVPENEVKEYLKTTAPKKIPAWFYAVLIILPVLFFTFLETGLRIFHYGIDYQVFTILSNDYPDLLVCNPELPYKYFRSTTIAPAVIADPFDKVKKSNAFRVFVIGESSAEGWPYSPNASFPRYLKRRLELVYPESRIEVINLGMSAINTYTMIDILPSVLKQEPDLIIFYNGHNEYYGALGAGSSESYGSSMFITKTMIWLQDFKTIQLLQNTIKEITSLFMSKSEDGNSNETLMERMVGNSLIPLNSKTYNDGIDQFRRNMKDMLAMIKKTSVPVILGTVVCNLKDQFPFVSINETGLPRADTVFRQAKEFLNRDDYALAKKLFYKAKELDALRFRAPAEMNNIINELGKEFNYPVIDLEKAFNEESPDGIVGNNLIVDHLHPDIKGYNIMGQEYFRSIEQNKLLPKTQPKNISDDEQEKILETRFPFTHLDSVIADLKLRILIGSYPFTQKGKPNLLIQQFKFRDYIDTIAADVINRVTFWEKAHINAAKWYFEKKDFILFKKEIDAVIADRPFSEVPYGTAATMFIDARMYDDALPYLKELHKISPSGFTTKWIGQIELNNKNYNEALNYLEQSLKYNSDDFQVWYNLSGAYFYTKKFDKSLEAVKRSLQLNPQNQQARILYGNLINYIKQNKIKL
jgi:tetratricopeptide (TPR) repeat protein